MTTVLLAVHALATAVMVGVIWTMQGVHYPLLAAVGDGYVRYQRRHVRRITAVIAVPWGLEALTVAVLLAAAPPAVPTWAAWLGAALFAVTVASTVLLQAPAHRRLADGFDASTHRRLVTSNWLRTTAWTVRGALAVWMLARV